MTARATLSGASILAFAIATGEMFLMTSPFAAYFYGLYSPLLGLSHTLPWLSWLSEFWLPHVAPGAVASTVFALGVTLATTGSILFLTHASYLYWTKFRYRAIATRLLYSRVRHPQYTCLILAGAGFALLWPRFINLILFLAMTGAYYALARSEEARMKRVFPFEYAEYARRKPMFSPGAPGRRARRLLRVAGIPGELQTAALVVLLATATLAGAFGVRTMSVRGLATVPVQHDDSALLVAYAKQIPSRILEHAGDVARRERESGARLIFVTDSGRTVRHLLIDAGIKLEALPQLGTATGDYYLVRAVVDERRHAVDALRLGSFRRLDGVFVVSDTGEGGPPSRIELGVEGRYPHASVPLL